LKILSYYISLQCSQKSMAEVKEHLNY